MVVIWYCDIFVNKQFKINKCANIKIGVLFLISKVHSILSRLDLRSLLGKWMIWYKNQHRQSPISQLYWRKLCRRGTLSKKKHIISITECLFLETIAYTLKDCTYVLIMQSGHMQRHTGWNQLRFSARICVFVCVWCVYVWVWGVRIFLCTWNLLIVQACGGGPFRLVNNIFPHCERSRSAGAAAMVGLLKPRYSPRLASLSLSFSRLNLFLVLRLCRIRGWGELGGSLPCISSSPREIIGKLRMDY